MRIWKKKYFWTKIQRENHSYLIQKTDSQNSIIKSPFHSNFPSNRNILSLKLRIECFRFIVNNKQDDESEWHRCLWKMLCNKIFFPFNSIFYFLLDVYIHCVMKGLCFFMNKISFNDCKIVNKIKLINL